MPFITMVTHSESTFVVGFIESVYGLSDSCVQWATCSLQCKEGTIFLVPESGASCENMFLPLEKKKRKTFREIKVKLLSYYLKILTTQFKLLSMLKF